MFEVAWDKGAFVYAHASFICLKSFLFLAMFVLKLHVSCGKMRCIHKEETFLCASVCLGQAFRFKEIPNLEHSLASLMYPLAYFCVFEKLWWAVPCRVLYPGVLLHLLCVSFLLCAAAALVDICIRATKIDTIAWNCLFICHLHDIATVVCIHL